MRHNVQAVEHRSSRAGDRSSVEHPARPEELHRAGCVLDRLALESELSQVPDAVSQRERMAHDSFQLRLSDAWHCEEAVVHEEADLLHDMQVVL